MFADLTEDDLTTLVEALDAWERKDFGSEMVGLMLEGMLSKDKTSPEAIQAKSDRDAERVKRERETAIRKEQSVMLKAKLLTIRNSRRVESVERESARFGVVSA